MNWLEVTVGTLPGTIEIVAGLFEEMNTGGVVIEDPLLLLKYAAEIHPDEWGIEEEVSAQDWPLVKAYFPAGEGLQRKLADFLRDLERLELDPAPRVSTCWVAEEDWANAWRSYYQPTRVGQRLVIKPSWLEWSGKDDDLVIEMDPGLAFGCGTHVTTRLCLVLLEKHLLPGSTVYDVGTGSGILALAAAKLGAGQVTATDFDEVACRVALENVARNGLEETVQVTCGNLLEQVEGRADLIAANIIADVIIPLAPAAAKALRPGGIFIASGIIRARSDQVREAMRAAGMLSRETLEEGHWVALVGEKE